jgi:hypothetical protein
MPEQVPIRRTTDSRRCEALRIILSGKYPVRDDLYPVFQQYGWKTGYFLNCGFSWLTAEFAG